MGSEGYICEKNREFTTDMTMKCGELRSEARDTLKYERIHREHSSENM